MAFQGKAYGFSAEQKAVQKSKYDLDMEKAVVQWINKVVGTNLKSAGPEQLQKDLQDGVILCNLVNKIKPGSVKDKDLKQSVGMNIIDKQRIAAYNAATKALGLPVHATFEGGDLRDGDNMTAVVNAIFAFGRLCHDKNLPNSAGGLKTLANKGSKMDGL